MKLTRKIFLSISLPLMMTNAYSALSLDDLEKVTSENNPKCVEYYYTDGQTYCSLKPFLKTQVDPALRENERLNIEFDNRIWQPIWGKKTDNITTIEYIVNGDDIDNWKELITSQYLPGMDKKISFKQYAAAMEGQMKQADLSPEFIIHEETPNYIILEFKLKAPSNLVQDELQYVTKDSNGFYVFHYAIKKPNMDARARKEWIKRMKKITIKAN